MFGMFMYCVHAVIYIMLKISIFLVQILQQPDTFRDEHTDEVQALFDDAAQACAAMWAQLKERRGRA